MSKNSAMVETALAFVDAGFALLPLKGKAPESKLLPKGDNGRAATDPLLETAASAQVVETWFRAKPRANVGLFSGAGECPVLVVDLDPAKCHDPARKAVLEARGELSPGVLLPPTPLQVRTGSGGRHLYYKHPPKQSRCVTRVGHRGGTHVDVQAEGRYLVLPPSIHPDTGEQYIWVDEEDRVLPLARVIELLADLPEAPAWCVRAPADDRDTPEAPRVQSGDWIAEAWTSPIPEGGIRGGTGGRKQTLRSLAQSSAKREIPLNAAVAQLQTWNRTLCRPPLSDHEVTSITSWIYERVHEERAQTVGDRVSLRSRGPSWPHDLFLGTKFGRWVDAVSQGADRDLVAVTGLGTLGTAATGGYRLHYLEPGIELADRHWVAQLALWIMPAAESGLRKSAAYGAVLPALESTQITLGIYARRYNAELEDLREQIVNAKKALGATRGEDRENAIEARQILTQRLADLPQPLGERWLLSDATPESFLQALSRTNYLGLVSDEGKETIGKFFGHYSGSSDMNGVLKAWDGGVTFQSRIGRGDSTIRGVCSMLTMVQPSVLRSLTAVDAEERGLMARFLFSVLPAHPTLCERELPKAEIARYCSEFEYAIRAIHYGGTVAADRAEERARAYRPEYERSPLDLGASSLDLPGDDQLIRPQLRAPVDILFRGECIDALKALESDLRDRAVEGGEHYTARGWARKAHEHAMRIAAVLQLCEDPPKDHEPVTMSLRWVECAISLVRHYFLPHYYCAKDLIDQPPLSDLGLHILTHFGDRDCFTLGEAATFVHKRTPDIRPVLQWLEQVGALRLKTVGKSVIAYPLPNCEY